jgi:excisionase family DNA binding protein
VNLEDLRTSRSAVVTVAQAAPVFGVDVRTVTRAIQNGELPALRLGRRVLIPRLPLLACLGVTVLACLGLTADGDLAEAADPPQRIDGSKGAPETTVQA